MRHAESRKNDEEMSGGNASDRKDMVLNLQARRREVRTSIVCRESQVIPRRHATLALFLLQRSRKVDALSFADKSEIYFKLIRALVRFFPFFQRSFCSPHQRDKQSASSDSAFYTLQRKKTRVPLYCCAAWMATNGILLYAMKKPLNDERTPDRIRNRLIGQKNAGDNESHYLMITLDLDLEMLKRVFQMQIFKEFSNLIIRKTRTRSTINGHNSQTSNRVTFAKVFRGVCCVFRTKLYSRFVTPECFHAPRIAALLSFRRYFFVPAAFSVSESVVFNI
ncbi:hypothetical protein ALC56_08611 [Trachymyrmex septentrionalis]|uniref:Uncharacterized protein n=1 Tax=Trachymyrmex septentrionalis TaxID=34720 RepID=A0A195F878_9HYME|nr:hypothetical protein ALC56_08611 [Trachymyrmex septentrionalis]